MQKFPIPDFPRYEVHVENDRTKIWSSFGKGKYLTPSTNSAGYYAVGLHHDGKQYQRLVHRLIGLSCLPNPLDLPLVDHINGDPLDNRLSNLRWVTGSQNSHNKKAAKGYSWRERLGKWQAQIQVNGKIISLGYFIEESDAHLAYLDASDKYFPGIKT